VTYHVIYSKGKWKAKKEGASKASRVFKDKDEAISYAQERTTRLVLHKEDGSVDKILVSRRVRLLRTSL